MTFVSDCLDGKTSLDKFDNYIDAWHGDSKTKLRLHEYLGLSKEEYKLWLEGKSKIQSILKGIDKNCIKLGEEFKKMEEKRLDG